jgi:hypothetical protein
MEVAMELRPFPWEPFSPRDLAESPLLQIMHAAREEALNQECRLWSQEHQHRAYLQAAGVEISRIDVLLRILREWDGDLYLFEIVRNSPLETETIWVMLEEAKVSAHQTVPDHDQPTSDPGAETPEGFETSRRLLRMVKEIVERWRADDPAAATYPRIKDICLKIDDPFTGKGERQFSRLAHQVLQDIGSPHTSLKTWIRNLPLEI